MSSSELAPPPAAPGESLARGYRVIRHLARGKALDVYDVWSDERHALCVAKVARPDRAGDAGTRRRLRREGRLLLRVGHPHLVRAYELVERPHPVLVLESLTGATLGHLIDNSSRRLPQGDLVYLGLQLCSAVRYLHNLDVLHLDLKPANIISENGLVKLIDLSVARPPGRARPGVGTRQYMSPEQARGGELGPAADVWGIGAVVYAAATGRRPFYGLDSETTYPQLEVKAASVRTYRRLSQPLSQIIDRSLEPDPDARPTSAQLFDSLQAVAEATPRLDGD
ncbi:MAG: serine/threonine protein kinase [Gaiellaceae bacterium MAG52_C11]|nr:serine/threonine protein kinase [Candidatus Gaiellasilicea maunaloa]